MTKEAESFWKSVNASNFPYSLQIGDTIHDLIFQYQVPKGIGKWLHVHGLIPPNGNILDIGSGSTTVDVFGEKDAYRSFAVDISVDLLTKNKVPQENKINKNIGTEDLPKSLYENVSLVVMSRCSRYLDEKEKIHAASEIFSLLKPNGYLVIIDVDFSVFGLIGEAGPFDIDKEVQILANSGFTNFLHTSCDIEVKDDKFGGLDYVRHKVIIVRKPYRKP